MGNSCIYLDNLDLGRFLDIAIFEPIKPDNSLVEFDSQTTYPHFVDNE